MKHTWSKQQGAILEWFAKDTSLFKTNDLDVQGHLVIRARAGCGKTTILIEGVKRAPERAILICAFSKIIQLELEHSIGSGYPNIKAQTLHSVGFGCVRRFRDGIKVEFGDTRANKLTNEVCGPGAPDAVKRLVSRLHTKGREITPHAKEFGDLTELAILFECEPDEQWVASGFNLEYVEVHALKAMELAANIQSGETIDGSDMIFLPVRNGWLTKQYDMVAVDEAQDMTPAQLEIALGVLKPGGRMAIIGDDRQAIFAFRGADSESLDRLKAELNASELGLNTTYRCGHEIVHLAAELVPDFMAGENNPTGEVLDLHPNKLVATAGPGDFILSRVNAPLVKTAMKLLRSGKRARVAGRDIGKGLVNLVRKLRATSVPDFLRRTEAWGERTTSRLEVQLSKAAENRQATIRGKIEEVNDQVEMLTSLAEGAKNVTEIQERIESLFEDDGLGIAGTITCSSVHKAKGLEANRVFVLADTLRDWNKEELNITYVAYTRAKDTLFLVSSKVEIEL